MFQFSCVSRPELPSNISLDLDYTKYLSSIQSVQVIGDGHQRSGYTVAYYKAPGKSGQWWVWYPSGKMWTSYSSSKDKALRKALGDAWLYA